MTLFFGSCILTWQFLKLKISPRGFMLSNLLPFEGLTLPYFKLDQFSFFSEFFHLSSVAPGINDLFSVILFSNIHLTKLSPFLGYTVIKALSYVS